MKKIICITTALLLNITAFAADKTSSPAAPMQKVFEWTAEQRESMAKAHENMAACLRSEKSLMECHDELRSSCQTMTNCPMMMGPMKRGMYRNQGAPQKTP